MCLCVWITRARWIFYAFKEKRWSIGERRILFTDCEIFAVYCNVRRWHAVIARDAFRLTNACTRNRFPAINLSTVCRAPRMTVGQLTMALCWSMQRVHNSAIPISTSCTRCRDVVVTKLCRSVFIFNFLFEFNSRTIDIFFSRSKMFVIFLLLDINCNIYQF